MRRISIACVFLGGFTASAALTACDPDKQVGEFSTERYDACEKAYECATECPAPSELLAEYPCFDLDTDSEAPNCKTTDALCKTIKEACFLSCKVDECGWESIDDPGDNPTCDGDELRACLIPCQDDETKCEEDFVDWLQGRSDLLLDFQSCLRPCEGGNSRDACAEGDVYCDKVDMARHNAVNNVEACEADNNMKACNFSCDDPSNGYYLGE